jgi:WD40 repeat protein
MVGVSIQPMGDAGSPPTPLLRPCRWLGTGAALLVRHSSDGSLVGVMSGGSVKVLGASDGKPVGITPWQRGSAVSFDFSPDATLIAIAGVHGASPAVQLWNLATGALVRSLSTPAPASVAFSPDGQLLAVGDGQAGGVTILHVADFSMVTTIPTRATLAVGFSGDGKTLWMVGNGVSYWYSVAGWAKLGQGLGNSMVGPPMPGDFGDSRVHVTTDGQTAVFGGGAMGGPGAIATHPSAAIGSGTPPSAVDISGDGTTIAGGTLDGHVDLYGAKDAPLRELTLDKAPVRSVAFSPSAATITAVGDGGTVTTWNVADGSVVWSRQGPASRTTLLNAAIAGGRFAAAGGTGTGDEAVWQIDSQSGSVLAHFLPLDSSQYGSRQWSARQDGQAIAYPVGPSGIAQLDPSGHETMLAAPGVFTLFGQVEYSSDGRFLAGLAQTKVGYSAPVWEATTGHLLATLSGGNGVGLGFSADGSLLGSTGMGNPNLVVWDVPSGNIIASYSTGSLAISPGSSNSLAFSHSKSWVATTPSERGLLVWSLGAHRNIARLYSFIGSVAQGITSPYPDSSLRNVAFSPSDELLAANAEYEGPTNGTIVFRFNDGAAVAMLPGASSGIAFLDEHTIVRGEADGTVTVWCLP